MSLTVLQVIPHVGAGGAEQACVDVVRGLVARGDKALVVSAGGARVAEIENAGGTHICLPAASKNPAVILANAARLARIIREKKVDVVHVRSRAPAWSAWIACRKPGCRFVATFHAAYKFSGRVKKFYNRVMTRADRIIAISDFIAAHIRNSYGVKPEKIRTIYRGIDTARFAPEAVSEDSRRALRKTWGLKAEDRIVLLPARLSPIKGHKLALAAMTLLRDVAPQVVLVILGDDQGRVGYRRELEEMIVKENLEQRVKIVPHCDDMPTAYALAEVVLAPSLVPEGFGRVPVEAQAMGLLVIASDLGATRETVQDGVTGWLLPPQDPAAWSAALQKALALSPEEKTARALSARAFVVARYTTAKMVADTLGVYDDVMKQEK